MAPLLGPPIKGGAKEELSYLSPHPFSLCLLSLAGHVEEKSPGPTPGLSLELLLDPRMISGRRGGSTGGGVSGALVAGSPVALILVGGDVDDTMPRPASGARCGSRSLLILRSCMKLRKSPGGSPSSTKVDLTPPGRHPLVVEEGFLFPYTSSGHLVVYDARAVGDDHALCGVNQRAWCLTGCRAEFFGWQ